MYFGRFRSISFLKWKTTYTTSEKEMKDKGQKLFTTLRFFP